MADRERAALGWTEAMTRLSELHTHESPYEALKAHFTEEEQVKLTLAIVVINGWMEPHLGCFSAVLPIQPPSKSRQRRPDDNLDA